MKVRTALSFAVKDNLLGQPLSPSNMSLPLLSEFAEQVATFLRGSGRTDISEIKTVIKEGSFAIEVEDTTGTLTDALEDYEWAVKKGNLNNVDPVRARIIELWQYAAKRNDDRVYELFSGDNKLDSVLVISNDTDYKIKKDVWVDVELYLYGRIFDLGGKNRPNVHLELEGGKTIRVSSDVALLTGDRENRLYKRQLVRIKAKQNTETKKIKDETLLSFEHYRPEYDEDAFMSIVKKARLAWRSVENATTWVEELRGSRVG